MPVADITPFENCSVRIMESIREKASFVYLRAGVSTRVESLFTRHCCIQKPQKVQLDGFDEA